MTVKNFENLSILGKNMDNHKVGRFFEHSVYYTDLDPPPSNDLLKWRHWLLLRINVLTNNFKRHFDIHCQCNDHLSAFKSVAMMSSRSRIMEYGSSRVGGGVWGESWALSAGKKISKIYFMQKQCISMQKSHLVIKCIQSMGGEGGWPPLPRQPLEFATGHDTSIGVPNV